MNNNVLSYISVSFYEAGIVYAFRETAVFRLKFFPVQIRVTVVGTGLENNGFQPESDMPGSVFFIEPSVAVYVVPDDREAFKREMRPYLMHIIRYGARAQ